MASGINGSLRRSGKMRLLPLIAATYFMVSGGPYGLEDIIGMARVWAGAAAAAGGAAGVESADQL